MNVRATLATAATLIACSVQTAAAVTSAFGFKAGVNFAEFTGDINLNEANARAGVMGGAFIQHAINPQTAIRFEALWASKGTDFSNTDPDDSSVELDYIEFPILFVVDFRPEEPVAFHAFLGPTFGFITSAKAVEDGLSRDLDDYVEHYEFGIAIGLGFEYVLSPMSIVLDGRYSSGFTHVIQDLTDGNSIDVNNRGIGVMAGLAFPLGAGR